MSGPLDERMWTRREIENYLCTPEVLRAWAARNARESLGGPLFQASCERAMADAIAVTEAALATLGKGSP
ncbi:MAG: hypothetical protein EPO26_07495 [Chloroflexota bacterium]|nr:MAG: hypothetical protein EPO26_07495 [Chloroflexota bacterium]